MSINKEKNSTAGATGVVTGGFKKSITFIAPEI